MTLAQYIERELENSSQCKNKEELANLLGVNYKTLCGWFNRNAFSLDVLFSISRVLDIDLQELRMEMPLTNKEVIQLYNIRYEKTAYELEGYFVVEDMKDGHAKKLYAVALDKIESGMEVKFNESIPAIVLKEEDIKELLKGYEVTVDIESNVSFSFYMKKQGDYLLRKMLEDYTVFQDRKAFLSNSYLTEKDIDVFFEKIRVGDYEYYGEVKEAVGSQTIEKWVEITPLDTKEYTNRILLLK